MNIPRAIVIGNSDGIGLGITRRLIDLGWEVSGVSRSESSVSSAGYRHIVADVTSSGYSNVLVSLVDRQVDLCVYCAGIGELLDIRDMSCEEQVFQVNLIGMVKTVSSIVPVMVQQGSGHFVGLSSIADELLSAAAPSYHASKAGFTNYLEGLARAVSSSGVSVSNVRFGFVDTKLAKGPIRPFMMSVPKACDHLEKVIRRKPVRYTAPVIMTPLIRFRTLMMKLGAK